MKQSSALAQAESLLLTPFSLTEGDLSRTFGQILKNEVDYADLYFQYSRSEAWSLDEGIVKSGSFNIDQGVGVRALSGEKTAFAYSDDISSRALGDAANAVRAIGALGQNSNFGQFLPSTVANALYVPHDPIASLPADAKVKLLERLENFARALDSRVVQVMASLAGEYEVVLVAGSDGRLAADVRPLVRCSVSVIVEENGKREQGGSGGGGRFDFGYFDDEILQRYAKEAVHQAITNLHADPAPAGQMTVVLASGWPGILLHEAVGHGLEGDFNRKGGSAFNGRLESFAHLPLPRMTNTMMLAGEHDPQEIIKSVKKGIYAANFGGGQVDITSGKFVFSMSEAYLIEDGKVTRPIKGATLIGNGPDALTRVSMIGNDLQLDPGVGTCGKDGQSVPVGVGQPTLRIDGLTVGGTA